MPSENTARFFDQKTSSVYDEKARKIAPVSENLHFLIRLTLADLPADARVLCVGTGTGTEILMLARDHPCWRFTGIEPSASMLALCREKLERENILERCELHNAYLSELDLDAGYDAVLCLLVTHFIRDNRERQQMFTQMAGLLKPGGTLINAEISFDTDAPQFASIIEPWKALHKLSGASAEQASQIEQTLREHVNVLPPAAIEDFLRASGLPTPVQFWQSLLIRAWYSRRPD
ncbi:class I SAM-dependent methyltransferase [Ruficoccus amylovorans]|uniref:Class I SAM-dependent methyltransferase n=1 Tax=Ruficoccus amylovorans TaxID=1804625 RepID=A0A842HE54_9BACT|nr:class I SAM-dependent methyltransferase [Ruficoccus amylovorans]MBC2593621.1 class I SAM-dependent methyltransferase [Ruficoccus amylovorans]